MKRLLSIELNKVLVNKSSRVLILVYFGLLVSMVLLSVINIDLGFLKFNFAEQGIFDFPFVWHFNTYIAANLKIFLAIIIVSMMSNEYTYGMLKQNLIDGLSKKEFLNSKFLTVIVFSAASTLFVFLVSLLLGLSYSEEGSMSSIFTELDFMLAYFVKLVGFFTLCLFLGILVKRSAFALGFLLIVYIAEWILYGLIGNLFNTPEIATMVFESLPLQSMGALITEPFTRIEVVGDIGRQMGGEMDLDYAVSYFKILKVLIWTGIFYWGSLSLLKSRDL